MEVNTDVVPKLPEVVPKSLGILPSKRVVWDITTKEDLHFFERVVEQRFKRKGGHDEDILGVRNWKR